MFEEVMTDDQASILNSTRRLLKNLESQVSQLDNKATEGMEHFYYGRLCEACTVAEDAVFNVLNTASSMLDSENAKQAIDSYR